MEYPEKHRQIVEDLMAGKFILSREKHFEELANSEEFYTSFFSVSFGYSLVLNQEYAYIVSEDTDETLSRDISIFFAIFCYELDRQGKNFLDGLQYSEYSFGEINEMFQNSSFTDLIQSNKQLKDEDARRKLVMATMSRRNIIEKVNEDKFYFTAAYKVYVEFAKEIAEQKIAEPSN